MLGKKPTNKDIELKAKDKVKRFITACYVVALLCALIFLAIPKQETIAGQYSPILDQTFTAGATDVCWAKFVAGMSPTCDGGTTTMGGATTQFDITNPSGDVCRYTFDGTGTNPNITASTPGAGVYSLIGISSESMSEGNQVIAQVIASGTNFFEITNATCVVEANKTLGAAGSINYRAQERVFGVAATQFDITEPVVDTCRFTDDLVGTAAGINISTFQVGDYVLIGFQFGLSYANSGYFAVTGSGENYFEVTNAACVAEVNIVIGAGRLKNRGQ